MQHKTTAYLASGAVELWLIGKDGAIEMHYEPGGVATSRVGFALAALPR
jgi:hypothetical protein